MGGREARRGNDILLTEACDVVLAKNFAKVRSVAGLNASGDPSNMKTRCI